MNADLDAIITQLFYYTNDMHDWLWGFGFDEASGNFQVTNFSGNGTAGDAVQAEAQDGFNFGCVDNAMPPNVIRCLNNANFGTNGDGTTARMQMFMWARPNRPYRDGSMDGDVIAHEYGHGVSNRLVPGTLSGAIDQAGSLGEGWSDTISFLRWGDTTVGEYVTGNAASGIRNFAYDVHPWTYGNYSTTVTSPHRNGEIWGATMYDIRVLLGINLTTQLVLDGMRSTGNGPSPTFLDARDGILANDQAANGEANRCALWAAFAGRGMGVNAVSNGLHAVPTEDFTLPTNCLPTADAGGPYVTSEGTDVMVTAAGSTPASHLSAGALVLYEWDLDNDGQFDDATGVTANFTSVGQDGIYTVGVQVTDEWGLTDTDTASVTVANVAPTVVINPIPPTNEHGTTTISGVISDPGWLDVLTASIDFDDGAGPQPLAGVLENVRPDATFTFSVPKQYRRQRPLHRHRHRPRRRHVDQRQQHRGRGQRQPDVGHRRERRAGVRRQEGVRPRGERRGHRTGFVNGPGQRRPDLHLGLGRRLDVDTDVAGEPAAARSGEEPVGATTSRHPGAGAHLRRGVHLRAHSHSRRR